MAERHHGGHRYEDERWADEPSRTERQLGEDQGRGRGRPARDWEHRAERYDVQHGSPAHGGEGRGGHERSYLGGRGGYGAERPGYEGAGHESGMGWGPEGRTREGYGRQEYGPEQYGRGEFNDRGQRGFQGFGGYEGYNERGLGGWREGAGGFGGRQEGPGGFGERSYAGYGDWSERVRDDEPASPLGDHRRRGGAARWGLGRSGSGSGWRHTLRRGAEEAQAGTYAGRGPRGYQRSDERIREDVCDCLMADPDIDASSMSVEVKDGEVTLEGTAPDRHTKRAAEDLVDEVFGVKQVHNRLRVGAQETAGAEPVRSETSSARAGSAGKATTAG